MAKTLEALALGIGVQADQATVNAAVRDATDLIVGVATGTDATGIFLRSNEDLAKAKLWNEVLEAEIDKVKNDPTQLEGLARTSLGMVREGETVYRFVDAP